MAFLPHTAIPMALENFPCIMQPVITSTDHDFTGRMLAFYASIKLFPGWCDRISRVRRKRYLQLLRGDQLHRYVARVKVAPEGAELGQVLCQWIDQATLIDFMPNLNCSPESKRASVIVNTVDREAELRITLHALVAEMDASKDELIVVLGPTSDDSESVIHAFDFPIKLLRCPKKNLAMSRNIGLSAALGEYVVFIDDDASPDPMWLDALLAPLADDGVDVSAGFVLNDDGSFALNRYVVSDVLGRSMWFDDEEQAIEEINSHATAASILTATGCNMGFKRKALLEVSGFDEAYRYFLEETDAVRRIVKSCGRCVVAPQSTVRHRLGDNLLRGDQVSISSLMTVLRSQLHFIKKFAPKSLARAEIENAVWERVLVDLERIIHAEADQQVAAELQRDYLVQAAKIMKNPEYFYWKE